MSLDYNFVSRNENNNDTLTAQLRVKTTIPYFDAQYAGMKHAGERPVDIIKDLVL